MTFYYEKKVKYHNNLGKKAYVKPGGGNINLA